MNKPPKKKKPFKKTGIGIVVPFDEVPPVKAEAKKNRRSFGQEARSLIVDGLEHRKAV